MSMYNTTIKSVVPTGLYKIGTAIYHLIDKSREEQRVKDAHNQYRELMMQCWYPSDIKEGSPAPYVSSKLSTFIKSKIHEKKGWFFGSGYVGADTPSHSYTNAPIHPAQDAYPVVVFSPGFGAPCHIYTSIMEDLASHGFIVFGVNHTYTADPIEFPDGHIIELAPADYSIDETTIRYQDLCFVLNEIERINNNDPYQILTHRLDLEHIGVMGHSIGATAALELGQKDARCKAVINLDGMIKSPFFNPDTPIEPYTKPLMIMYNVKQGTFAKDDSYAPAFDLNAVLAKMKKDVGLLRQSSLSDVYEVQCKAHHMTFSDYFMLSHLAQDYVQEMRNLQDIKSMIVRFFEIYLKCIARDTLKEQKISNENIHLITKI